jgi:hypothetical protein
MKGITEENMSKYHFADEEYCNKMSSLRIILSHLYQSIIQILFFVDFFLKGKARQYKISKGVPKMLL